MRFCTITLGCKVNQYETGAIESLLSKRGHELVNLGEGCDICILNTCAVTEESVRKSRQIVRKMKKREPDALIAVCGCYSQLEPETVEKLEIDFISGTENRAGFAKIIEDLARKKDISVAIAHEIDKELITHRRSKSSSIEKTKIEDLPPGNPTNRTRALLKIQDGCDNYCAYCVIPYARGNSRSLSLDRIGKYAKKLEDQGYKEIIITGIEISSYGKDLPATLSPATPPLASPTPTLLTAIQTIQTAAQKTRLRLGSLDPAIITDEFCKTLREIPSICNHFHLSLQSGCDETLKRMGRKYTTNQVDKAIKSIRKHFPDCGITADLIVGFPGETEDEFKQSLDFIKKASFSAMHIFPFSPRPGTKAYKMPNQIDKNIKKERAKIAAETANEMADRFKRSQIDKTVEVLFEQVKNGISSGHTNNYLEVAVNEKIDKNSIRKVQITGIKNDRLQGEIV